MKKYKKILAALLAMNLAVGAMPTGIMEISASVESQKKEDTTEEVQSVSEGEENSRSIETDPSDTEDDSSRTADDSATTEPTETPAADSTDTDSEITDATTGDSVSSSDGENTDDAEVSSEDQANEPQEADDAQQDTETVSSGQSEETSAQAVTGTLELEQLAGYDASTKTMTIDSNQDLILLSNCEQAEVANIKINFINVGEVDITEKSKIASGTNISTYLKTTKSVLSAERDYTFQGIGDESNPFQGEITGTVPATFKIDHSFFGGLSSIAKYTAENKKITWCGKGNTPMIAKVYQFDDAAPAGHTLPIKIQGYSSADSSATMGSLIGTVKASKDEFKTETLKIGSDVVTYGPSVSASSESENSGLVCGTLENGTIRLDGYTFPGSYTVQSTASYNSTEPSAAGNAGGVIGVMKTDTTLEFASAVENNGGTVTAENGNAGGIVGLMQQGAKIKANAAVTLKAAAVKGGTNAGGVAGMVVNAAFDESDIAEQITVTSPTVTGASAGGFIGTYTLDTAKLGDTESMNLPNKVIITSPMLTANNGGLAGGYFGHLDLNGKLSYTIGSPNGSTKKEITPTYKDCSARALGAIAGKVTSNTIASTVLIQNMKITATRNGNNGINYFGGLVGELGTYQDGSRAVYLKVCDSEINVINPQVSENGVNGFGGIAGMLAQGSILKTEGTVKIATPDAGGTACATEINQGGGLVGTAEKSVIDLSGTTDLSGSGYQANQGKYAKTGWLAGQQDCALIYAEGDGNGHGWSYIRGEEKTSGKQAMNDIGNYGQIIRLYSANSTSKLSSNLITIDENHAVNYKPSTAAVLDGNAITIGSEDAFALLSIAWNSRGYFGGVTGITSGNTPREKNITLNSNIDLTGSGIAGLSRDSFSDDDAYTGIFDGKNHTITLAIGETFGFKQENSKERADKDADGYGEVISAGASYHGRQGIFAKSAGATIQNLTVKGNISVSNAGKDILVGGIAGELSDGKITRVRGVKVEETTITADCANNDYMIIGGFFGGSYNAGTSLMFEAGDGADSSNTAGAVINAKNCTGTTDDSKIDMGGVIGEVGESDFTFEANCLTVKGSITMSAQKRAYAGGLIGIIKGNNNAINHQIKMKGVTFDTFKINAPNVSEMCGGLFGSIWADVNLYFGDSNDTDNESNIKLDVIDAEINAPKAMNVGGLAYRSSGKWEIQDHGIDLKKLTIKARKNVGLLVCRGENATDKIAGSSKTVGALYLSTTKYWDSAYKISADNVLIETADQDGVFDEFVAYTTPSAKEIIDNKKNGVISIATKEENGTRVGVDVSGCTTYQNRTTYGKSHPTNGCSRYYYDLDRCLADAAKATSNRKLDTPQELLLWSVYNYASNNIRTFFSQNVGDITTPSQQGPWYIGEEKEVTLDLSKYSYYPIKYESGGSINIIHANIIFNNEGIENNESENKSTQGKEADHTQHTQHYIMHCGLFLSYQSPYATFTVKNVKFSGSIGKVNESTSGVLFADFVSGNWDGNTKKYININITSLTLDGLKVNNCGDGYAPLLINNISRRENSSYTYGAVTLNVDGISMENYTAGTPVASSLIGWVGSEKAKEVTMSFQNIVLPDKKADGTEKGGVFSHATLLEWFKYSKDDNGSGATYNFNRGEEWTGETYNHQVTYGKEITASSEFAGIQKWYYDENNYETDAGLIYDNEGDKKNFDASGYLPYVYTAYDEKNCTHEIKVNQRVADITKGCGTYGHPYRITRKEEMKILSEYMAGNEPRKDWRVTITVDQSTVHKATSDTDYSSSKDVTYQYDGNGSWKSVDGAPPMGKEFMREYLLNAYYDIRGAAAEGTTDYKLTLTDFKGFGTATYPFRGVITSKTNATVILQGKDTGNGLIPYSYGSVVKDITISYSGDGKTLKYPDKTTATTYPEVCFGGVIGCILGGDNIIDNVTVQMKGNWLTLGETNKHLLQVGGYVGSICGGGVIFRNMETKAGLTDNQISNVSGIAMDNTYSNLYINPYVGRVMDGFAFCEAKEDKEILKNTNKNYKINTLVSGDTSCVAASGNAVTVKNKKGLLILSAIVNSGAASDGSSDAYYNKKSKSYTSTDTNKTKTYNLAGKYGKVRNALYSDIGADGGDAALSIKEDIKAPGPADTLPYLISKYCGGNQALFSVSTNSNVEISFVNSTFDMTDYKTGYQGIAARYVSNAVASEEDNNRAINNPSGVIPELKSFNGNGSTVIVDMQVREYTDDDFHAASVGGLFNVLRVSTGGSISNLIVDKNSKGTKPAISLEYYDANGKPADIAKSAWSSCEDVGVGGLAGSLVGYTNENGNRDITMNNIQINELTITSPGSAGGIVGNTGKPTANTANKSNSSDMSVLLQPQDSQIAYGIAFESCSYKNLNVSGKYAAGGFAGYIGNKEQNPRSTVDGFQKAESGTKKTGESSTITATDSSSWAGGLFGYVGTRMFINMTDEGVKKDTQTILQGVSVQAGREVGGCIGRINQKCYGIHNVIVKGTGTQAVKIALPENTPQGTFYAGGIIGYARGETQNWTSNWTYAGGISGSSIEKVEINDAGKATAHDYTGTGKLRTNYITGGIAGQISGGKTRIEDCAVTDGKVYGSVAGGITGQTDSEMQFIACKTEGTAEKKTELKGFSTAGGILGFWAAKIPVTLQNCEVQYLAIEGKDWGVGILIGDAVDSGVGILYLFDSSAKNSTVTAGGSDGRWPCAGGIIGNLRNTIKSSNILLSGITLSSTNAKKGLLFGEAADRIDINIAGISIQNVSEEKMTGAGNVSTDNDYIAFADYAGTSESESQAGSSKDLLGAGEGTTGKIKTEVVSPYTVTSPKNSTLKLYADETAQPQYLYGDGASWTDNNVKAKEIWTNRTKITGGHYAYKKISDNGANSVTDFKFDSVISTYSANQTTQNQPDDNTDQPAQSGDAENTEQTTKKIEDFPVVQIGAGSADIVKDYLNILTNGAFSAANEMNRANDVHVKANVDVYQEVNGKFVKQDKATPVFAVSTDNAGKITFSTTTGYDNGEKRFNLLTVTFTEKEADGTEHHYNVFVPVLVRRMLEVNFSATLSYGTNFRKENYSNLRSHVLESFGSSITAYLSYTYNSDEKGKYTEYGWQSYINAGGDVAGPMKRELCFVQGDVKLPAGTQLSLVDCRSGKVYYYTVEDPVQKVDLSAFKDSGGNSYEAPSIAELMKATAAQSTNGTFLKVDANGKPDGGDDEKTYASPTVRIWNTTTKQYEYYRRAEEDEAGTKYTITVDESTLKNSDNESTVSESYYLVITVPKNSSSAPLNGSLQTSITNTEIPHQIHYKTILGGYDDHNNKASTYLISKGYQQELKEEQDKIDYLYKKMSAAETVMKVDVVDKITFPNGQAYLDNSEVKDELYQRFTGGLQKTINGKTSAEQFPSGTTGVANFYVYKMNGDKKNYYKYDNTTKTWSDAKETETVAASYTWTSDGGNMELPLADSTIDNVISLQGVRQLVRNGAGTGDSVFYVEVRMDASIPASGLNVIPESEEQNGRPKDYVKLVYSSQLSTEKTSLSYSTNRASAPDTKAEYYREEPKGAKLTYEADQIGQLGINLLDLQYLDASEEHSLIDTTAIYDLASMKNLDDALKNSSGIQFSLSLSPKNTEATASQEEYQGAAKDANQYLSVELKSQNSGTVSEKDGIWSWTVPKETYWKDGNIHTDAVFDGSILTQAIQLKVNVQNVESEHFYSNYKVVLTARILGVDSSDASDNIIYTLAKIKPEFVEKTSGN